MYKKKERVTNFDSIKVQFNQFYQQETFDGYNYTICMTHDINLCE